MPIPLTVAWLVTKMYEDGGDSKSCGYGYTFLWSYWILEGPRIAAVMVRKPIQSLFLFERVLIFEMNPLRPTLRASLATQAQSSGIAGLLATDPISSTPWTYPQRPHS